MFYFEKEAASPLYQQLYEPKNRVISTQNISGRKHPAAPETSCLAR